MTGAWMARLSMRSAPPGSTAGLLARRAALAQGKFFFSFNLKRRNKRDSGRAGGAALARRAAAGKQILFGACVAKSKATPKALFPFGTSGRSQG